MNRSKNVALINVISSLLLQLFTLLSGFIIPKLIISTFGSDVNGLIASINQFLGYIALLEGGVTAVITTKLYKPLIKNNMIEVSSIINTAKLFYRKISIIYMIYSILFAIIAPLIYDAYDFSFLFLLSIALSINLLIQYTFSLSLKTLLNADRKVFVVSFVQIVVIIANVLSSIILIKIYPNVILLKLISSLIFLLQPILYYSYVKKNYCLKKKTKPNNALIKERWSGFANNIAYFIHNGTDVTILSLCSNLIMVSVYSVYSLVTSGLKSFIGAINNGIYPSIGRLYASGDYTTLRKRFNMYEFTYLFIIFAIFTVTILQITPFVSIYIGANEDDYIQVLFGILLSAGTMLDLMKTPHVNLAYSANMFKKMIIPSFIEALLNISISLLLVFEYGLVGVAIGTLIAMLYRYIYQLCVTKKIIGRPIKEYLKIVIPFCVSSTISVIICKYCLSNYEYNIFNWILHSFYYIIVTLILQTVVSLPIHRKNYIELFCYIFRRKHEN